MAGIIKRANSWVAVIKVGGGKEVRISTRVPVSSDYLKPGETLKASEVRNQAAARAVAYELEKKYQGYMPDVRLVELSLLMMVQLLLIQNWDLYMGKGLG